MRRVIRWLIPLVLITFGLLWPLVFQRRRRRPPTSTTRWSSAITRPTSSSTPTAGSTRWKPSPPSFPSGRHGIFRYWDVANQNSPRVRQKPEITSVLIDGEPAPYQMLWEGGERFRVAKIGDPDQYLELRHPRLRDPLHASPASSTPATPAPTRHSPNPPATPPTSPSVFFWNVVARSWNNRIQQADISVTLPGDVAGAQCSVGFGVGAACRDLTVSGNKVELSARYLRPRTPVTVRAGVDVPTPPQIGTAVALHLGSDPRPVADRRAVDRRRSPWRSALGGVPLVPHHRRAVARIPAAVRAAAGPRAGADRIHPHREPFPRTASPRRCSISPSAS